jgi:threonine dehydrogenase-like Zn-dependent dehydrogenase
MRAAIFHEPHRVEAADRPDATLREPTDAVVRVEAVRAVSALTDGVGVDSTLECVGTGRSWLCGRLRSRYP